MGAGPRDERGRGHEAVSRKGRHCRYGEPEEIAGLMAYLVSKEARWLTGASVRMDGGEIKGI